LFYDKKSIEKPCSGKIIKQRKWGRIIMPPKKYAFCYANNVSSRNTLQRNGFLLKKEFINVEGRKVVLYIKKQTKGDEKWIFWD